MKLFLKSFRFFVSFLVVLLFGTFSIYAETEVTYENDLLSVNAEDISISQLLSSVTEKTKVTFSMNGTPPAENASVSFDGVDLEQGLQEIFSAFNVTNFMIAKGDDESQVKSVDMYFDDNESNQFDDSRKKEESKFDDYVESFPAVFEDDKLNINLEDEDMYSAILIVEGETGIIFNVTGDVPQEEVSIKIENMQLKQGIEAFLRKLPLKGYRFSYNPYTDPQMLESVDVTFPSQEVNIQETKTQEQTTESISSKDTSKKNSEEDSQTLTGSKKTIEDASSRYMPPGSNQTTDEDTSKRVYTTEIKDASSDYRPPGSSSTGSSRPSYYGDEGRNTTSSSSPRPSYYGDEGRNTNSSSSPRPSYYGDENR